MEGEIVSWRNAWLGCNSNCLFCANTKELKFWADPSNVSCHESQQMICLNPWWISPTLFSIFPHPLQFPSAGYYSRRYYRISRHPQELLVLFLSFPDNFRLSFSCHLQMSESPVWKSLYPSLFCWSKDDRSNSWTYIAIQRTLFCKTCNFWVQIWPRKPWCHSSQ